MCRFPDVVSSVISFTPYLKCLAYLSLIYDANIVIVDDFAWGLMQTGSEGGGGGLIV